MSRAAPGGPEPVPFAGKIIETVDTFPSPKTSLPVHVPFQDIPFFPLKSLMLWKKYEKKL